MSCADRARRECQSRRPGFRPRRPVGTAAPSPPSSSCRMARAAAGLLLVLSGLLAVPTSAPAQALTTLVDQRADDGAD